MKRGSTNVSKGLHLVIGGGGFAGFFLGKKLSQMGNKVRLLDIEEPVLIIPEKIDFIKGDIRNYEDVIKAMKNVSVVYHMASFGMSGNDQLKRKLIEDVNIHGTENVLKGCFEMNVTQLVYTSTYNVVFGGQVIINGDETLPYLSDDKFTDYYSKTKKEAEKKVLAADGVHTKDGSCLHTCALRLAGIYGPGEQRTYPRIVAAGIFDNSKSMMLRMQSEVQFARGLILSWVQNSITDCAMQFVLSKMKSYLERGMVLVTYGTAMVDFLHVNNLVDAHILAARALTPEQKFVAAGQVYFISDGKPIENFEFFRTLFVGLGYSFPKVRVPVTLMFYLAFILELIHSVLGRIYDFEVFLTRTEVYKTGVTHTFSIEKARRELGYEPAVHNDMNGVVQFYKQRGRMKKKSQQSFGFYLMNILIGFLIASIILSYLPMISDL